ncbi:MAG: hypothetical protein LBH98_06780 [Chitinispirillales bacterium]|jgi:hypothetical protein|nr:hypothetical protein [Chitinispirillales bacterium]
MPRGRSAKNYKRVTALNQLLGIFMLAALIAGIGFLFNKLVTIMEKSSNNETVQTVKTSSAGKINETTINNVKEASDLNKKAGGL